MFFSGAPTLTQTLVDTQMTTSNFQLTNSTMLSEDNSEDSQNCANDNDSEVKTQEDLSRVFKEYIPGDPDSNDEQGLVPYVDTDDESNISASTTSSLQPEETP